MKKILIVIVVIFLGISLTNCKEKPYLDKLVDQNGEYALTQAKMSLAYESYKIETTWTLGFWKKYFVNYDYLYDEEKLSDLFIEYVDRVVVTSFEGDMKMVEVIECNSEEDAIIFFEKIGSAQLYRNKNLIFTNTPFAWLLLYGNKTKDDLYEYPVVKTTIVSVKENIRTKKVGELIIPEEVKSISAGALHTLKYITKVVCGKSLKVIGNNAFTKSNMLEEVIFNEGLEYINFGAFMNVPKLKYIKLPTTNKYIGMYAFWGCNKLEYVIIPDAVEYVGNECFSSGVIYCEASSKPEKWDENFVCDNVEVYWGNEWEYNEDGIPEPIKK